MNLKNKNCLIYDYGLFVSWAEKLAEDFGTVKYYMPWKGCYPSSNFRIIGSGLKGVERVDNFFDEVDGADLIVFPDCGDGDMQVYLRSQGKRVWGSGKGEILELDRWWMKKTMKELGMPVQKVWKILGLGPLREFLKKQDDKYVKVSTTRGDFETFHHETYQLSEPRLDELEWKLGAKKHILEFIVEDAVNNATEIGYDGFTIDGQFGKKDSLCGIEIKGVGLGGAIMPYADLPEPVRWVNAKLAPLLKHYQYRGFFSTEVRINEKEEPFLIDPCCRCGSPPNELYQEMFDNWAEVLWEGAAGNLVEPHATTKYGIEVMIHSSWSDKNWQAIHFPPEIARWVKLRNNCIIDGKNYVVPTGVDRSSLGAVIGIGDTFMEAIKNAVKYASQVKGHAVSIELDAISKAMKEFSDAEEKHGMKFGSEPIPEAGDVAELLEEEAA